MRVLTFAFETVDSLTGCVESVARIEMSEEQLSELIGQNRGLPRHSTGYLLHASELKMIEQWFAITISGTDAPARLRPWSILDSLPYTIHTNRELKLMLAGLKPLAYFQSDSPRPNDEIPERYFDPYVDAGKFVKREYMSINALNMTGKRADRTNVVLYALPHHEWRIDAFILLKETAVKAGWNEGFERLEGSLLGYEDWQNEIFIDRIYKRRFSQGDDGTKAQTT